MPEYREIEDGPTTVRLLGAGMRGGALGMMIRTKDIIDVPWREYVLSADAAREVAAAMLLLLGCAVMIEDVDHEQPRLWTEEAEHDDNG